MVIICNYSRLNAALQISLARNTLPCPIFHSVHANRFYWVQFCKGSLTLLADSMLAYTQLGCLENVSRDVPIIIHDYATFSNGAF